MSDGRVQVPADEVVLLKQDVGPSGAPSVMRVAREVTLRGAWRDYGGREAGRAKGNDGTREESKSVHGEKIAGAGRACEPRGERKDRRPDENFREVNSPRWARLRHAWSRTGGALWANAC